MKRKVRRKLEMLPEYDFRKGIRGKYAARYAKGTNIVLLEPDVARVFPSSKLVNETLRAVAKIAHRSKKQSAI
jgi:hypothetical protein